MKQQGLSQISFTQPIRQIVSMLLACALLAAGLWFIRAEVLQILHTNPWLNAFIIGVFTLGSGTLATRMVKATAGPLTSIAARTRG